MDMLRMYVANALRTSSAVTASALATTFRTPSGSSLTRSDELSIDAIAGGVGE
jgi:hypothetical protein